MANRSRAAAFLRDELPGMFARGMSVLERRADDGEAWAKDRLDDIRGADGVAWIRFRHGGDADEDVYLDVRDGAMTSSTTPPDGRPRALAVAIDGDLADQWLDEAASGAPDDEDTRALGAAVLASRRAADETRATPLRFHVHVSDVPDLGKRTVAVNMGDDAPPPDQPAFAVSLSWTVIEDLRDEEITPQQMFTGGKLRFSGDYARALSLGMKLAQRAEQARRG